MAAADPLAALDAMLRVIAAMLEVEPDTFDVETLETPLVRMRLAYLDGTESWSRETTGRDLSDGDLEGVIRRFR